MPRIFIKMGGSLITDKKQERTFNRQVVEKLAQELKQAVDMQPDLQVLLGHGSGSFGHFAAMRYGTINGVTTPAQWLGFAEVARAAHDLNQLVAEVFLDVGLPVLKMHPSSTAIANDGQVQFLETQLIETALSNRLIPIIYGDVAYDTVRGGTILSTESLFNYLAMQLQPNKLLLLGNVDGVYMDSGDVIQEITPSILDDIRPHLGGSGGTDVTGGMLSKVVDMLQLVRRLPDTVVYILNGHTPKIIQQSVLSHNSIGTKIHAPLDESHRSAR